MSWNGDEPLWCLRVIDTLGNEHNVHGARSDLKAAFDRWKTNLAAMHWEAEGITNTADRAPLHICIKTEEIRAMHLEGY